MEKDKLNRSWAVAFRWGYRKTEDRPTYGRNPTTPEEIADKKAMNLFWCALKNGLLPRPDRYIGRDPYWRDSTIDAFIAGKEPGNRETPKKKRGRPALSKRSDIESEAAHA